MKKRYVLAITLAWARVAAASPESDVQAIVKDTIDHVGDATSGAHLAKGAIVVGHHGNVIEFASGKTLDGEREEDHFDFANGRLWPMVFGNADKPAASKRTLGAITVVVDGEQAWFEAPLEIKGPKFHAMHVAGIAAHGAAGWTIQWLNVGWAIPDRSLRDYPVLAPAIAMKPADAKDELGKAVVSWFTTKSLAKHAASGTVLAGGSAPEELASDAAALKLAASWDKLKLVSPLIRTGDTPGVATVTVWMPLGAERDGVAQFVLTVYAVKEAGAWKWRSLQFVDDQVPGWE
ncbi:MAG TPA: hypothetical protein VGM88_07025 [Kofleriaceae bacterium]|jgi:hypothetical protein